MKHYRVGLILILAIVLQLIGLHAISSESQTSYNRRDWKHWTDEDGNCRNTRAEVLIRESLVNVEFRDSRMCSVLSGLWLDVYTARFYEEAALMDIDHIVPLSWAHARGGYAWDAAARQAFANDLVNLTAVHASVNRSKGSKGPDQWLPPNLDHHCKYLADFMLVVMKYELMMAEQEAVRLSEVGQHCNDNTDVDTTESDPN